MGMAYFDIIYGKITVWNILNLLKGLTLAANFNGEDIINQEITCAAEEQAMGCLKLIDKKCFTHSSYFGIGSHCVE